MVIDKCSSERNRAADSFVDLEGCMCVGYPEGSLTRWPNESQQSLIEFDLSSPIKLMYNYFFFIGFFLSLIYIHILYFYSQMRPIRAKEKVHCVSMLRDTLGEHNRYYLSIST